MEKNIVRLASDTEEPAFPGPRGQPSMRCSRSSCIESSDGQSAIHRLVLVCKMPVVPEEGGSVHQRVK